MNIFTPAKSFLRILNFDKKALETLSRFSKFEKRFRYFFLKKGKWIEATFSANEFISVSDNSKLNSLKNYIVAYRNGQLAYESRQFNFYPSVLTGLDAGEKETVIFTKEEFEKGKPFCEIIYSQSPVFVERRNYYQTTIKNISHQRIRILRFGAFAADDDGLYKLNTITGGFFTGDDFGNWYMDNNDCWICPKQSVSDPINYGGARNNWAYQIETEAGDIRWIGEMN